MTVTRFRRLFGLVCLAVLLGVTLAVQPLGAAQTDTSGGGVVVIANGWSSADVGAAAPLANRLGGRVLYASADALGTEAADALKQLLPSKIILMGGTAALTAAIDDELFELLPSVRVDRLSGADRIDTAARAAAFYWPAAPPGRAVVVANGWSSADVGAAAPLAAGLSGSVLFSSQPELGESTVTALAQLAPSKIILVGGTAALSTDIEAQLAELLDRVPVERLAGADRIDSAAKAALLAAAPAGSPVVIANGWSPADVGIAAPLAAALGGSVLFSNTDTLGASSSDAVTRLAPTDVVLVGSVATLTGSIETELAALLDPVSVVRIADTDRIGAAASAALYAQANQVVPERLPTAWLARINAYRTGSGLSEVVDRPDRSEGIRKHLEYLRFTDPSLRIGTYANAHYENPASPHYRDAGAAAGRSSNLGVATSDAAAIDQWMAAPFRAIGILRPQLESVAFARVDGVGLNTGLDVIRGLGHTTHDDIVLFPGPGSWVPLMRFRGELPSPLESCEGYRAGAVGLPLIIMLPTDTDPLAVAELVGPGGSHHRTADGTLCRVDEHTYTTTDAVYGGTGRSILRGSNAVFLIADTPLIPGRWTATYQSSATVEPVSWSFNVYE